MQKLRHLAIIMDGNGRWALSRALPRFQGHESGVAPANVAVRWAVEAGLEYLTLFAFSTENQARPFVERQVISQVFQKTMLTELPNFLREGIRVRVIGDDSRYSRSERELVSQVVEKTAQGQALTLNICYHFSGRWHIEQAMKSGDNLSRYFAQTIGPDPDMLIRTGGECRISNFMLWNVAYTELLFLDVYWPDFSREHLQQARQWYTARQRRFGQIHETVTE